MSFATESRRALSNPPETFAQLVFSARHQSPEPEREPLERSVEARPSGSSATRGHDLAGARKPQRVTPTQPSGHSVSVSTAATDAVIPDVIRRYLEAHDRLDTDAALSLFAPGARVFDDGREYLGLEAIRDWLARTSSEFTYTRTFLDACANEPNAWLIRNRLEGNFPGGVVDLGYRFRLAESMIAELVIEP
jgi:hypothetical protein